MSYPLPAGCRALLVIDLEATCWDHGQARTDDVETIEIGFCLVDLDTRELIGGPNSRFVKPIIHPQLSEFCTQLTGITQDQVDRGLPFPKAVAEVIECCERWQPWLFCSWGKFDKLQLTQDCQLHGIENPFAGQHCNLAGMHKYVGKGRMNQRRMMRHFGLEFEGRRHSGAADAYNYARMVRAMLLARWFTQGVG